MATLSWEIETTAVVGTLFAAWRCTPAAFLSVILEPVSACSSNPPSRACSSAKCDLQQQSRLDGLVRSFGPGTSSGSGSNRHSCLSPEAGGWPIFAHSSPMVEYTRGPEPDDSRNSRSVPSTVERATRRKLNSEPRFIYDSTRQNPHIGRSLRSPLQLESRPAIVPGAFLWIRSCNRHP